MINASRPLNIHRNVHEVVTVPVYETVFQAGLEFNTYSMLVLNDGITASVSAILGLEA